MPSEARTSVLLVVFDGCRPDALAQTHTPHVDALCAAGAHTWTAQTVVPSWSLPTHTSMFRGVSPEKHGIHNNVYQPSAAAFNAVGFSEAMQAFLKSAEIQPVVCEKGYISNHWQK